MIFLPENSRIIEGPSGAGKTTTTRLLGEKLSMPVYNSGVIFRAMASMSIMGSIDDPAELIAFVHEASVRMDLSDPHNPEAEVYGAEVTHLLQDAGTTKRSVQIAANPASKAYLEQAFDSIVALTKEPIILEGKALNERYISHPGYHWYLTAAFEERARRKWLLGQKKDPDYTYATALQDTIHNDHNDKDKLSVAPNATILDTTRLTVREVAATIGQ